MFQLKSHTQPHWDYFLWFLILAIDVKLVKWTTVLYYNFYFNLFFPFLQETVFVNFFLCTRWRVLLGWKRKPSPPVLSPFSSSRSAQHPTAKQTAVQAPQIITQESHWERCPGSGCDSVCASVFTDIHLHMSQPQPIRGVYLALVLGEYIDMVTCGSDTFIIPPNKIVSKKKAPSLK